MAKFELVGDSEALGCIQRYMLVLVAATRDNIDFIDGC